MTQLTSHRWNIKEYKNKIVESVAPKEELDELEQYIFVVRARIGEDADLHTCCCC